MTSHPIYEESFQGLERSNEGYIEINERNHQKNRKFENKDVNFGTEQSGKLLKMKMKKNLQYGKRYQQHNLYFLKFAKYLILFFFSEQSWMQKGEGMELGSTTIFI